MNAVHTILAFALLLTMALCWALYRIACLVRQGVRDVWSDHVPTTPEQERGL